MLERACPGVSRATEKCTLLAIEKCTAGTGSRGAKRPERGPVLAEYPGPEHARLREAFREWILGAAETWGIEEEVSDPKRIARIGDRIIECETGEEQLARARET